MSITIEMKRFHSTDPQGELKTVASTSNLTVENLISPQVALNLLSSSNAEAQTGRENTENWNVVSTHRDEYGILHKISVHHEEDSVSVFGRIKEEVGRIGKAKGVLHKMMYFGEQGIFDATITQRVSAGSGTVHTYVDVGPLEYNPLLTAAFHNRIVLKGNDFIGQKDRFAQPDKAIVISWKVNKKYVTGFILVLCALTVGLGILIGMLCHNAGLGIGVSGGLASVLSVLAFVLMRLAK